jgi:hypothetical protein
VSIAGATGRRWALIALPVLLVLGGVLAVLRLPALGSGASAGTTPTSYEPRVLLHPDLLDHTQVTAGPAMNRFGQLAIVTTDARDRWHLHALDGGEEPIRLTGPRGSPAPIHPPAINDRGYVVAAADVPDTEHGPVRDVRLWSAVAGREWLHIDRGRLDVDAVEGREQVLGTEVALDGSGPFHVVISPSQDGGEPTHHLTAEPAGVSPALLESHELETLRPVTSAGGTIVLSTGTEVVVVEPGFRQRTTVADEGWDQLGRAPAISADGSAIAFAGVRDGSRGIWLSSRDMGGNWSRPVLISAGDGDGPALEPLDIDAPLGVAAARRPPEDGDPVAVSVLARTASSGALAGDDGEDGAVAYTDRPGLWTLSTVLRGADPDASTFTTRLVAQVGARIGGDEVTGLRYAGALTFPEPGITDETDHWIAYVAVTEAGELVVRATPTGSWVDRAAKTVDEIRHDHGEADDDPGRFGDPGPNHQHGDRPEDQWGRPHERELPDG